MILGKSIQDIKDVPIQDVIGHYVKLKRRGSSYIGLCPFHDERTPSFNVSPVKRIFKCFGCGIGGDAIKFVREYEKKSFIEAVELIAGTSGIFLESEQTTQWTRKTLAVPRKKAISVPAIDIIPQALLETSSVDVLANPLTAQLARIVGEDVVTDVLMEYKIQLNGCRITYPQIDVKGRYRTGKGIYYEENAHRACTNPKWVHDEMKRKGHLSEDFRLKQCFTGEHLINNKAVAIVEGQSTMLFMATLGRAALKYNIAELQYFAGFTWLSTGGSDGIGWKDEQVIKVLRGKEVVLFPDAGFYYQWRNDAEVMEEYGIRVQVSFLLEKKYSAGILKYNDDLRDYFMQFADEIRQVCNIKPITFYCSDILYVLGETHTGRQFSNIIIACLRLKDGQVYDVLFDESEDFIQPGKQEQTVQRLASFYEKEFKIGLFDGTPCWVSSRTA